MSNPRTSMIFPFKGSTRRGKGFLYLFFQNPFATLVPLKRGHSSSAKLYTNSWIYLAPDYITFLQCANPRTSMIFPCKGSTRRGKDLFLQGAIRESALKSMRESDLVLKGHEVYVSAMTIPTELIGWNVTQQEIDDLGDSTDSYLSQNPTIRNIRAKSTQATSEIKEKMDESYNLIKDPLDALMLPFKKINPTFYGEYLNTRLIISHAATHQKPVEPTVEVKV